MLRKKMNEVREPQQQRSIQRADDILEAAQKIIIEKGYAKLTITEIAERANVTPGSMYQYFKNKSEIILMLAKRNGIELYEMFRGVYQDRPSSVEDHAQRFLTVLDGQFLIHYQNPAIRDVWMGAATDKEMQNLFEEEDARALAFHVELAAPFFPAELHEEMTRTLLVIMRLGISATLAALEYEHEEALKVLETTKRMVMSCWWDFVEANAIGTHKRPS
jgi:AcrR family transcriptional regulator